VLPSVNVLLHYLGRGGTKHYQLFTVTLWSAVCAVGALFVLVLEFSIRNMFHFLDDVHTEVLNEPVDDSGSEGDVSETECSPSKSDSDSGM